MESLNRLLLESVLLWIFIPVKEKTDENLFCFLLGLNHNYIGDI